MLSVLGEDYIKTAEAKGLRRNNVIYIHALRNAILPVITISGVLYARLLGGTVLAETIFSWPGMGLYAVTSIMHLDFQPIMGFAIIVAVVNVTVNLIVDILYVLVDPRIRF
jgi:peptide/nickel transport system permease protein